jgi:hypothetical protein
MTFRSRVLRLTVGAATLLLGVGAFAAASPAQAAQATATAQAASSPSHTTGDRVLMTPAAPPAAAAHSAAGFAPAAVAPTISPSVATKHEPPSTAYTCYTGDLCPVVWDPTTSSYKIFFLYNCARYSLYNWEGTGNYSDRQTSGAHSYFYGSSGNVLTSFYPPKTNVSYNWTPVYSIRNC